MKTQLTERSERKLLSEFTPPALLRKAKQAGFNSDGELRRPKGLRNSRPH